MMLAVALMGAGSVSAWAVTNTSTATGIVGATDNTSGFNVIGNKAMSLAAGDEYVITFVNYNKGASGTDYWENWAFISNVFSCRSDHGASNPSWGTATNVSYTGNSWSDIYSSNTQWLQAYNGVTVTLTVSRTAAGTGITVAHTATTNAVDAIASQTYAGTFTATVDAATAINFYLTCEDAHLNITNVVHTNASGEVTHYELNSVDLSDFSGDFCSYNAGVETFSVSSLTQKWCTLDLSDYFSGITGTITNVNMSLTNNIECVVNGTTYTLTNRFGIGVYGNTRASFGKPTNVDVNNSVTWWGITGNSAANRIYYKSSSDYVNGLTLNTDAKIDILMDMVYKKFSYIQDGTIKVNNQNFIDTEISQPKYLAVQTWSTPVTAAIKDLTLEIVYLETTYYTATFTNTTSGNAPSVTIYSNSERTSPVANGMLEDGKTYYFTATEVGYQDYNGSFTVSGSDPAVNFAMTAKTAVSTITVKYKLGDDEITSEAGDATGLYVGENHSVPFRLYVQNAGKLYKTTANGSDPYYGENVTLTENTVVEKSLTEVDLHGGTIKLFEDLDDATSDFAGVRASYCSAYGNKAYTSPGNLEEGLYTFIFRGMNKGRGSSVKVGETTILNASDIGTSNVWADKTLTNVNIPADGKLTFVAGGSSTIDYFDIIIAVKQPGALATLSTTGYTTFASSRPLNLSGITSSTGTTKAYYVTASDVKSSSVALTEATGNVAAGTGLILNGTDGATVTIPVVASGTDLSATNMLKGCTVATDITSTTANYENFYVLGASVAEFQKIQTWVNAPHTLTIPAGKAYLDTTGAGVVGAPTLTFDFGETTGINAVKGAEFKVNGEYYDLQGRRVAQPTKGLYIVNGRKVVIK